MTGSAKQSRIFSAEADLDCVVARAPLRSFAFVAGNDASRTQLRASQRQCARAADQSLAQKENLTLPSDTDAAHVQLSDRLGNLSGENFDREWANAMVDGHQKVIAKFEQEARSGRDTQVKSWAAKTLPTLREHLQHARDLQSRLGSSGTGHTAGH